MALMGRFEECFFGEFLAQYARLLCCDVFELENWRMVVVVETGDRNFFAEVD